MPLPQSTGSFIAGSALDFKPLLPSLLSARVSHPWHLLFEVTLFSFGSGGGLSYGLKDVQQHSWLLPTRSPQQKDVSRHCQVPGRGVQNHTTLDSHAPIRSVSHLVLPGSGTLRPSVVHTGPGSASLPSQLRAYLGGTARAACPSPAQPEGIRKTPLWLSQVDGWILAQTRFSVASTQGQP